MDLDRLLSCLRRAFPEETIPGPLRLLGEGFSSTAVQAVDGMAYRIGRTASAAQGYTREAAMLPRLRGLLPVEIPQPRLFLPAGSADFPYGLIAHPTLPGEALEIDRLSPAELESAAIQVAEILLALRRIPLARLGLAYDSAAVRAEWLRRWAVVLPTLREILTPAEYRAACAWWDALLADGDMGRYAPAFQHGDLWYGNLLTDGSRITAIIDWSYLGAGDPAFDFAPQFYPGEAFFSRVVETFRRGGGELDPDFHHRLARLRVLRELDGLEYAVLENDPAELADAIVKLRGVLGFPGNTFLS